MSPTGLKSSGWRSEAFLCKALEGLVEGFASTDQKGDRFVGFGVSEIQSHGRQEHAVDAGPLIEHLVPSVVPVAMVTEDRMAKVV